jgi:hypothetical protein
MNEIIALRLVEALEKMARQSQEIMPLPDSLLTQLGDMRQQLSAGQVSPPQFGGPTGDV